MPVKALDVVAAQLTQLAEVDFGSTVGPGQWLYLVPAGDRLIASGSTGTEIVFRELDPTSLADGSATWPTTKFAEDVKKEDFPPDADVDVVTYEPSSIPDHAHIFDGTHHWVAVTLVDEAANRGVGVVKITAGGDQVFAHRVYDAGPLVQLIQTQDLWCVLRPGGGLAIGLGRSSATPGVEPDLVVLLLDEDGNLEEARSGIGEGVVPLSKTGSATYVEEKEPFPYQLVIPAQVSPCTPNPIYLVQINADWSAMLPISTMLDSYSVSRKVQRYGFGMPSQVTLPNGHRAVAVRRIDTVDGPSEPDCEGTPDDPSLDDCSPIVLLIYDNDDQLVFSEEVVTLRGTRPHISAVGYTLYVAYDTADTDAGVPHTCRVATYTYEPSVLDMLVADGEVASPVLPPRAPPPALRDHPLLSDVAHVDTTPRALLTQPMRSDTTNRAPIFRDVRALVGRTDAQLQNPDYADWLLTPSRRWVERSQFSTYGR